jgi:RNA polymerase sigma factor (sigma-70 family)
MTYLISRFSTFYQVNPHPRQVEDSGLAQNLRRLLQQHPELNDETALLRYFCEAANHNSDALAIHHLMAYVDSACYCAAFKIYQDFGSPDRSCVEYLQIARDKLVSRVTKLCAKYEPSQSHIKTYAFRLLQQAILSEVRQSQEMERLSDWRLLRKFSKKSRKTALEQAGIKEPQLSNYLLVWQGFLEVYAPVTGRRNQLLPAPNEAQLQTIAQFCSEQQFSHSTKTFTVSEIQKVLQTCVNVLRQSSKVTFKSLDLDRDNSDLEFETANQSEPQEYYLEPETADCDQHEQVKSELAGAIASLPPDAKKMLILEHGLTGFNQSYIGKEFDLKQYQVSRQLQRYKIFLLEVLVQWSQAQANFKLSVEAIDNLRIQIDEWLTWYCQNAILCKFLQTSLRLHPALNLEISLLYRYYGTSIPGKVNEEAIAYEFNITPAQLQEKLAQVKTILQAQLHNWMQRILELKPCSLSAMDSSSALLVEKFLTNAPYALLESERK